MSIPSLSPSPAVERAVLTAVRKEFDWAVGFDASHVAISIDGTVITLSGEVPALPQVRAATKAALGIKGVSGVSNDITVRVPWKEVQPDREIVTAVVESLFWTATVPRERVKVDVTDKIVTLTGELDWNFQREDAERVARRIVGVHEVRNEISLPERASASDAGAEIRAAFVRSANVDAGKVDVAVEGNVVTLTGEVGSFAEKFDAGRGAWSSPHVTDVRNLLTVKGS